MDKNSEPPDLSGNKTNLTLLLSWKKIALKKPPSLLFIKKLCLVFLLASAGTLAFEIFLFNLTDQKQKNWLEEETFSQEKLIISNGNALLPISSLPNPEPKIVEKLSVVVTAYSSTPWETWGDPFVTAAGTWVKDGIIANNHLPFGTRVRMPEIYGDKIFIVEDRMHSRKGDYHFDVWFPSYWQAIEFGAKRTYIEVLEG